MADGLRHGERWTAQATMGKVVTPTTLLLAPDRAGINRLEDATALRAADRANAVRELRATAVVIDAGHCIHRDNPTAWLNAFPADQP